MSRRTRTPLITKGHRAGEEEEVPTPLAPETPSKKPRIPIEEFLSRIFIERVPLLTAEQIRKLVALKFQDETPIFSQDDKYLIYEIVSGIASEGYDAMYDYLNSRVWTNRKELIMESPSLKNPQNKLKLDIQITQSQIEVAEGIYTCRKCKSKKTQSTWSQTRSADEPATIIVTCVECGNTWKAQ